MIIILALNAAVEADSRNVMIYFDNKTKESLINKFYDWAEDGGYLIEKQYEIEDSKG